MFIICWVTLWQTFGKFVCSQSVTELIFRDANFNAARSSIYTEILAKLFSKKELTITHKNKKTDSLHIGIMRIQNVTIHNNYCEMWNSKYSEMPTFMQFHLPASSEIKYSLNLTIWSATSVKYGEIIKKRCILGPAPKWPYFNVNLFAILLQWIHCFLYCKAVSLQKRYLEQVHSLRLFIVMNDWCWWCLRTSFAKNCIFRFWNVEIE